MKSSLNILIKKEMQTSWNLLINNKLRSIKPSVGYTALSGVQKRSDESRLHRLRIGHTYLTHKHLLNSEERPVCQNCQVSLTVEHILITCTKIATNRLKYYTHTSLFEIFQKTPLQNIINFINEIEIYDKI